MSVPGGGYSSEFRAAMSLCAWVALLSGVGFGVLPRERLPRTALVSAALLAALALLSALSALWASDVGAALEEAVRVATYLALFGLVIGASRRGEAMPWLRGLVVGIVAVAVLALASRLIPALPGGDEEINRFLPAAQGRLSYPIGYWNGLAAMTGLGVVLLAWFGAAGRTVLVRATSIALIPFLGLAIYLASSRGGVLAVCVGLIALLILGPKRPVLVAGIVLAAIGSVLAIVLARSEPALLSGLSDATARSQGAEMLGAILVVSLATGVARLILDQSLEGLSVSTRSTRIALSMLALLTVAGIVISDPPARFRDFKKLPPADLAQRSDFIANHLASGSGSGRWQYWGVALDAFGSQPAHGIGAGGYATYWNQHAPIGGVTGSAHSLYLEQLGELGVAGLVCILGFALIGPVSSLIRGDPAASRERGVVFAIAVAGLASAAVDWTWDLPAVFGIVVVALGLLAGPVLGPPAAERAPGRGRDLRIATIALGVITIPLAASIFLSDRELGASQAAVRDGNLPGAESDALAAISLQPWSARPRIQLALVDEAAADLGGAAENAELATDRAPDDWRLWLVRARVATRQNRVAEAQRYLAEARRLAPHAPLFAPGLSGPLPLSSPVVPQPSS